MSEQWTSFPPIAEQIFSDVWQEFDVVSGMQQSNVWQDFGSINMTPPESTDPIVWIDVTHCNLFKKVIMNGGIR